MNSPYIAQAVALYWELERAKHSTSSMQRQLQFIQDELEEEDWEIYSRLTSDLKFPH